MPNRFEVVKRGYDTDQVDEYLERYVAELEAVVKSYKDKDSAIKNAILSAQVAADSIIRNAKNRSFEMKENAVNKIQDIVSSIAEQRQMLKNFQDEYNRQIGKYLHDVNEKEIAAISKKIDALEDYLTKFTANEVEAPEQDMGIPELAKQEEPSLGQKGGSSIFGQKDSDSFLGGTDDLLSSGGKGATSFSAERDELSNIFNLD